MKNKFELKYSPEFYNDFYTINFYIKYKLKNRIASDNLLKKVEKEIKRRLQNPLGFEQYNNIAMLSELLEKLTQKQEQTKSPSFSEQEIGRATIDTSIQSKIAAQRRVEAEKEQSVDRSNDIE